MPYVTPRHRLPRRALAAALLGVLGALVAIPLSAQRANAPTVGGSPPMPRQRTRRKVRGVKIQVVAQNLEIPWALQFSPDGRIFFTERPGRVRVMTEGGTPVVYKDLTQVTHHGEGGLMGMALHPQFPTVPYVYLHYTMRIGKDQSINRVSRFRDTGQTLAEEAIIIDNIPASQFHDGGALAFGPDGMLYVGTGDARTPGAAQQIESLAGKILRVGPDGQLPLDNPIPNSPVWAYGFRNVSGITWNPVTGEMWAASHGPTGEFQNLYNRDAVYIVRKGGNHGWPLVVGTSPDPEIVSPVLYYPKSPVPPGGVMFYTGDRFKRWTNNLFLASLKSEHIQRITVGEDNRILGIERLWTKRFGRLRAIAQAPDGSIYFTTSNRDGRERRRFPGADRIYRILPRR